MQYELQKAFHIVVEKDAHVSPKHDAAKAASVNPIRQLQQTIGNRAVQRLMQAKLEVSQPGDVYEQEADQVAARVLSMPSAESLSLQRQMIPEEEEKDKVRPLQRKTETITPVAQQGASSVGDEYTTMQMKSTLHPGAEGGRAEAGAEIEQQLWHSRGTGNPLPDHVREYMEPRFGMDFSQVQVHTGTDAIQMNRDVGAQAFTVGHDIYYGPGRSPSELDLTAHELTHVVQQTDVARPKPSVSERGDAMESDQQWSGMTSAKASILLRIGDGHNITSPTHAASISQKLSAAAALTGLRWTNVQLAPQAETVGEAGESAATTSASDSRSLTPEERSIAEFVFGPSLNLDPIVIKESWLWSLGGYVRTLPDTIYVAPGMKDKIDTRLLIHELTHCAQYQHGVSKVSTASHAINAHYDYGGEQGLLDAIARRKCFDSFNTEQQGDIVADYYLRVVSQKSTYPWSVFVDQVRAQGACIWPYPGEPIPFKPSEPSPGTGSG